MKSLHRLLGIEAEKKEMVCLVGAGGKTSVMFRLAQELSQKGMRILVTTTTAIYYPKRGQYDEVLVSNEEAFDLFENREVNGITVFGRSFSSEGKLLGINPEFLNEIFLKGIFDCIIVEGDGSKGRPVKAPAAHEPVIPASTTKLIGIIGLDSIGKEVCSENVHRPELFCKITGCKDSEGIDTRMLVSLIVHKEGLFKAAPELSERYLILNKSEGEKEKNEAFAIAQKLRDNNFMLKGIVISSINNSIYHNAYKRVSGIILASGLSKRMGTNKLLLPVGGIPLIERVIAAASQSRLGEVILVCASEAIASIGKRYGVRVIHNSDPQLGQSRSIKLGVEKSCISSDGFMFMVGDQPFITTEIINTLIDNFTISDCGAVVPLYNGKRGNPVVFSCSFREKLIELEGDSGGRVLLSELGEKMVTVDFFDEKSGIDIDTMEEYKQLLMQ